MKSLLEKLLYSFAKATLARYKPDIIGVTGSVGKTSTKEAILLVLKNAYLTRASKKNYNNEIGVPLTILGAETSGRSIKGWLYMFWRAFRLLAQYAKNYPWVLVLEMGADKKGDIKYLTDLAPCKVGVITSIAPAHLEGFGSIEDVEKEKSIMVTHLKKNAWAILNADEPRVKKCEKITKAQVLTYGFSTSADVRASDVSEHLRFDPDKKYMFGSTVTMSYKKESAQIDLPNRIGHQHVYSLLAAAAVGVVYDMKLSEIAHALAEYTPPKGRMNILPGIKHTLLIDDTYNAQPPATKMALRTLARVRPKADAKKIAVLGDMLELGTEYESAHQEIGKEVVQNGVDLFIAVGQGGKLMADEAIKEGFDKNKILWFDNSIAARKTVQDKMKKGDVVLIKGSQGMRMEHIVKEVMAEPERASELIVRQERQWLKR